ncbi:hypothetical protein GOP47_0000164 [Adiantum capillus-veneris]|uniref:Protein kinase domain-containing protein n=1 Tax=Adiantum capillus-veneris TaxID=13818 RepID=A0A9D4ZSU7_ADICA|nr:hypothetical protein GOP47_0000164 [Adiantum capillus-veneris]
MSDLLGVATTLLSVINKAIRQSPLHRLQQYAKWALDALRIDLEGALVEANDILNKGFTRSVWNAPKIQSQIQALRERVMTSFQTRLSVASLDVGLEGKHAQDAFQSTMLKVNKDLQEIYFSTSASVKQEMQLALRRELREAMQTLTTAMESQIPGIEVAVSKIRSVHPQTSDIEKFLEDVLAALDGLSVKVQDDAAASTQSGNHKEITNPVKWYQDPVTWETMVDPIKATDGHTYDRWTIVSGGLVKSPFIPNDPRPFRIATDDLDVQITIRTTHYQWCINLQDNSDLPGLDSVDDTSNSVAPDDTKLVERDLSHSRPKVHDGHSGASSSQMTDDNENSTSSQILQINALDNSSSWTDADEPPLFIPSQTEYSATKLWHYTGERDNVKKPSNFNKKLKAFTCLFNKRSNNAVGATITAASTQPVQKKLGWLERSKYGYDMKDVLIREKLVLFEENKDAFNMEDLLSASAEVLGRGSMGTAYKATLGDGLTFVVKRLQKSIVLREDFAQQIYRVRNVLHKNLVPPVGYYISEGEQERFLVYK